MTVCDDGLRLAADGRSRYLIPQFFNAPNYVKLQDVYQTDGEYHIAIEHIL